MLSTSLCVMLPVRSRTITTSTGLDAAPHAPLHDAAFTAPVDPVLMPITGAK